MVAHAFNTTELVEMVADHPDEPTVMTWTFLDGLDKHITPSSVRHRQPSTRLPAGGIANWTRHGTTRRVGSLPEVFGVLMAGRPTNSPRWLELTEPGDLWHPDIPRPRSS